MKSLRCISVMLLVLLSACDADKAPAPPPKVATPAPAVVPVAPADAPVVTAQSPASTAPAIAPPVMAEKPVVLPPTVHQLAPNVSVVPVVAAGKSPGEAVPKAPTLSKAVEDKSSAGNARSAKVKADNAEIAHRAPVANKSKSAAQVAKETRLPKTQLDLSLPPEMVKQMVPPPNVITAAPKAKSPVAGAKPLLPKMFPDADRDPDFQLQGRLLSNEMQLQLRNESRREVEGAALDFKFKQ